jgi:hypothetical protein
VKRKWTEGERWAMQREQVLVKAAEREERWMKNYRTKVELHTTPGAFSRAPTHPSDFLSPIRDELYAECRPRAEGTAAPTALTAKQLRLEAEFRRRQVELAREVIPIEITVSRR